MTPTTTRRSALAAASLMLVGTLAGATAVSAQTAAPMVTAMPAPSGLSGSIAISGSSTVRPITEAVGELFNAGSPGVAIAVDGPGTGDGFKLFCAGETDISDASRAIKPTGEADVCATNGVEYIELKIGLDGISVITSANNTAATCLSFADLYALTGPESTGVNNWKDAQAIATALGSTTVFPDAPLTITAPGEESGTYDFYRTTVIAPIAATRGLPADQQVVRPDYQASANDNAIITGVAGTPDNATTLGWVGFAYTEENLDKVQSLPIDGGKGCVKDSVATILDGTYPISRPLFIYVNKAKAAANPALSAFVDYYMAPGTIENVLQTVPYVNLPADQLQASRDTWTSR